MAPLPLKLFCFLFNCWLQITPYTESFTVRRKALRVNLNVKLFLWLGLFPCIHFRGFSFCVTVKVRPLTTAIHTREEKNMEWTTLCLPPLPSQLMASPVHDYN